MGISGNGGIVMVMVVGTVVVKMEVVISRVNNFTVVVVAFVMFIGEVMLIEVEVVFLFSTTATNTTSTTTTNSTITTTIINTLIKIFTTHYTPNYSTPTTITSEPLQ